MSNTKKKIKFFGIPWIAAIVLVLVSVGITCGVFKLTDNLSKGIDDLLYNEDNLIRSIEEYEGDVGNTGNGLTWTVYDDKSVKVEGTLDAEETIVRWTLGTVKVGETGKYTLSGIDGASLKTVYLEATYTDTEGNQKTLQGDITGTQSAEIAEGTVVTISIVVNPGVKLDKTIKPTFVLGEEPGKF